MKDKIICPKCKEEELEKEENRIKCKKCNWNMSYTHYLDLKKVLGGKAFLEGDKS